MVIEDHRFLGFRSRYSLATGGTTAYEIRGREHPTLAQQLDPLLLLPGTFPGSFW
jgi:hypothetical protein